MESNSGSIVTVNGNIDPDELGVTMPHEHLFSDLSVWMDPPSSSYHRKKAGEPIELENLWYVHRNPSRVEDNMRLDSLEQAISEMKLYRRMGGDSLVDVSPKKDTHAGDHRQVRAVARESGVNIVHGTGHYIQPAHPEYVSESGVDELKEEYINDVVEGINDTNVRAGIIGELGVSGQIHEDEEKVLRAGAKAALETGAPVTIHPNGKADSGARRDGTYPSSRWGLEILDILEDEGLPPNRVVMGHNDRALFEGTGLEYQKRLAERGAFVEYDLWGAEEYFHHRADARPSDVHRVEWVMELIDEGYSENLLFSQDICRKFRTAQYGGHGYFHVIHNIIPMLQDFGVEEAVLEKIVTANPRRMLTFDEPA